MCYTVSMRCITCGKTDVEFYPSHLRNCDYRCKSCVNSYNKQWLKSHPEYLQGVWASEHHRQYMRDYMRNHPEENDANFKRWYAKNAATHRAKRLAYARADPQRHNAQSCAYKAFPEVQVCEVGGCIELGHRHHDDYSKPKYIRWLCRKHHKAVHPSLKLVVGV